MSTTADLKARAALIAQANDMCRVWGLSALLACRWQEAEALGMFVMTRGVAEHAHLRDILEKVIAFAEFNKGNDPYGEHDFGAVQHKGERFFWKIDAYDRELMFASPDPTDTEQTRRVLTVMRADEY